MSIIRDMFNIDIKNFNIYTILSILFLLAGLFYYIYWGTRYGIWYDIGIYSITIVMIIPGVVGILLSLREKEEED